MKTVYVMAIIEFSQKENETDEEMLETVKGAIEYNTGDVKQIGKINFLEGDQE